MIGVTELAYSSLERGFPGGSAVKNPLTRQESTV